MKGIIKNSTILTMAAVLGVIFMISGCSAQRKLARLQKNQTAADIVMTKGESDIPELEYKGVTHDTLIVQDETGRDLIIMKAIKDDETGEMVANDVIEAATITARFRNVAERHGKVDLGFSIIVPASMQDSKWQLRFYPDMFVMGDSIRLDPVIITGDSYRRSQLKGYQQYDKFLSKIVSDTTKFIDIWQLEIFLKRNIPELYAFKTDSTEVTDEQFNTIYGVTQRQAVEHYTNKFARKRNNRRIARRNAMYSKYVKVPIVTEGIRLDTVIRGKSEVVYNYVQTINTRPGLRKVDVVLSGEIYERNHKIYSIPRSEPLTFYISSLSAFTDKSTHYMQKIIERRVSATQSYHIDFEVGRAAVKPGMGDNAREIARIKKTLASLIDNNQFDLDSVSVSATASPEGSYSSNRNLAQKRSAAVCDMFRGYMKHYCDSLNASGYTVDENGKKVRIRATQVRLSPRCIPENWEDLGDYVRKDASMSSREKLDYFDIVDRYTRDLDAREKALQGRSYYRHLKNDAYPKLRTVKFNFYLARKGMVKDTIHTTVVDTAYMRGAEALHNMDYETALVLLRPYNDYNTALAYMALDRNASALSILEPMPRTAEVNYLLAILYSRTGRITEAVSCYIKSCKQDHNYVYRGNLDPEISYLIKTYGLNTNE